ncbi:hypothetical protein [Rhizobium leguminosarum]
MKWAAMLAGEDRRHLGPLVDFLTSGRAPMIVGLDRSALSNTPLLAKDLDNLGIRAGDMVMVHAAIKRVGQPLNGPDELIDALRDAAGFRRSEQ